ncbi:MAG: DUF4440 domain-containing protein [Nevskiaceae bacterium]|nr:MAG: DUF4440 domain-containing protein [Nevskiaceae bacterium]TBR72264.1 MAG: DUF4440 domain-containing protein [Nevskiaceae bacterium]
MTALEEVQELAGPIMEAAAKGDFEPFLGALDDNVEIFDHLPLRIDGKADFAFYLQSSSAGAESLSFVFHQPSIRGITENLVTINAYSRVITVPKNGNDTKVESVRTTLVFVKRDGNWKIVTAHISPFPKD